MPSKRDTTKNPCLICPVWLLVALYGFRSYQLIQSGLPSGVTLSDKFDEGVTRFSKFYNFH